MGMATEQDSQDSTVAGRMKSRSFEVVADFQPSGQQPQVIDQLQQGLDEGCLNQTLLGVTGSGKTFTIANLLQRTQRPAVVFAPNKTLAAQLYGELREFLPRNAVEYFVSYYDYYQPEAYVPTSDTYIDKDATINEHIQQMRLSATKALLERRDTVVVCTVSAIYGLGNPRDYMALMLHLEVASLMDQRDILQRLTELQYTRNDVSFTRGTFRVRGDRIDVFPADSERDALRIELFDDEVQSLVLFDPLTGVKRYEVPRYTVHPKTHYATPREVVDRAVVAIEAELQDRLIELDSLGKLLEKQRLEQRTRYDIAMMKELGTVTGIENYSRHFSGAEPGQPPATLLDYTSEDTLIIVDESHVTIPQLSAMYRGDRSRKTTLVDFGFRLPCALDNRPLRLEEWEEKVRQRIFVSATPAQYEMDHSDQVAELLVRPTGILDPPVEIRPVATQVQDVMEEIEATIERGFRVLVTTLTKRMSEDLADFMNERNIDARYLHSDIDTVERTELIRDLRKGEFDVLIGINLLREGLDMPEVALVAILDADKEGFLRSTSTLIQTIGRAARNTEAKAILYADSITNSMRAAIDETDRRREIQRVYNKKHGITPETIKRQIIDVMQAQTRVSNKKGSKAVSAADTLMTYEQIAERIAKLEVDMNKNAELLEFEAAAEIRDEVLLLREKLVGVDL